MVNTGYKDQIIRYVLDSSNEENECLAVFIARMRAERAEKRSGPQAAQEKGMPVLGDGLRKEERGGAVPGSGSGAGFQDLS
jgi:hypothetical protein